MFDISIFDRAEFQDTKLKLAIKCEPGKVSHYTHQMPSTSFCIKQVEWKYEVAAGQSDYGWPKQPMAVSIEGCLERQTASPSFFSPPAVVNEKLQIEVSNPSGLVVQVHIELAGVFVAHKDKQHRLSKQEMLGYCLLDNSQKGLLALQSEANKRLLGMEGGSSLALETETLKQLPAPQPQNKNTKNLLVGDLVQYKLESNSDIDLKELTAIAEFLIDKSWTKYE